MRHRRPIDAPPDRVYAALRTTDLTGSTLVRLLFAIRTLRRVRGPLTLDRITRAGFAVVAERPGEEIVLGVVGRFWRASGERRPADREQFSAGAPEGEVLAAWNFTVTPRGRGSLLSTETRVQAGDARTLKVFARYWRFVRPGSGLIRRMILREVEREAR